MKKTLLLIMTVLTMVCIFALSSSAYEHKYYTIDVPEGYDIIEEDGTVQFVKSDDVFFTIAYKENDYTDFYNMSEEERADWDETLKEACASIGTVSDYESEFDGNGVSASAMFYYCVITNPEDTSEAYDVEGMVYSEGGILYNILIIYSEDTDYSEIEAMAESLVFITDGSGSSSASTPSQNSDLNYESSDGVFAFSVPLDFIYSGAEAPLDASWTSDSELFIITTLCADNTLHEAMAGLDDAGVEKTKNEVVMGAGNALQNAEAESVNIGFCEGVHIYGDYVSGANSADVDIYMFATYDTMYAIYFYDFGDADAASYKRAVLNTLNIDGDILYAEINEEPVVTTQPSQPATVPSTQPTVPTVPADVTEQTTTAENNEEDDDKDEEKDNSTLYIIIGAVVLIVIVAIIAIVFISNNKKKAPQIPAPQYTQPYNPQQYPTQNPPMNNYNNNGGFDQNNNF